MTELEYFKWIAKDAAATIFKAVAIYAVVLTAYWTLVG
jgi:hypothetical protein